MAPPAAVAQSDSADLKNPYVPNPPYLLPQALWERKMASYGLAQDLGLQLELGVTPNAFPVVSEPLQGPLQALVKLHARLVANQLPGAVHAAAGTQPGRNVSRLASRLGAYPSVSSSI